MGLFILRTWTAEWARHFMTYIIYPPRRNWIEVLGDISWRLLKLVWVSFLATLDTSIPTNVVFVTKTWLSYQNPFSQYLETVLKASGIFLWNLYSNALFISLSIKSLLTEIFSIDPHLSLQDPLLAIVCSTPLPLLLWKWEKNIIYFQLIP